jgi:hypothetical protein
MWSRFGMSRTSERNQHGNGDFRRLLSRHQPARPAQTGRQRLAVGPGLVGKSAERTPNGIGDLIE